MKDAIGQSVTRIQMKIDGRWVTVFPSWWVAKKLGYHRHSVTQLCDTGKLIATKFSGRWWIHEDQLRERYPKALPFNMDML